ncbi:MAG: ArsI/CadI family heavy metal resistance metalloenzyme [Acidimicrobiales bacterium]
MSRVQLALNVSDLQESIDFYTKFFGTGPTKIRPGYANFALDAPPLKLVLIEGAGAPGSVNHLGVEVFSPEEVADAIIRLDAEDFATDIEENTTCCYAVQDKVWVAGPDNARWEIYTVLSDAASAEAIAGDGRCCAPEPTNSDKGSSATTCC